MFVEQGHEGGGPGARPALVPLDRQVGLEVGARVGAVGEGAAAVRTRKGLLAGVCPDVPLQQPGPGEGLAAGGTNAGQRVGALVHLEGSQTAVLLAAELAGEGTCRLQVAL